MWMDQVGYVIMSDFVCTDDFQLNCFTVYLMKLFSTQTFDRDTLKIQIQ